MRALEVRALKDSGMQVKDIAERLGVCRTSVCQCSARRGEGRLKQ